MKSFSVVWLALSAFVARANEVTYAGSTPANAVVRTFLSIPSTDSIDFIRWKLALNNDQFTILCNYGIGQPNTNGFVQGGQWIEQNGFWEKQGNYYLLRQAGKTLSLFIINPNLLHVSDGSKELLTGNAGWSYTLNRIDPVVSGGANVATNPYALRDSVIFQGRTPCFKSPTFQQSKNCYKLKWQMVLIADAKSGEPAASLIKGTVFMHNQKPGTWSVATTTNGKSIYRVSTENSATFYLLPLDDNILLFTDASGNPLVGNEDFSFTLNRML
jgi:hypothetical protein